MFCVHNHAHFIVLNLRLVGLKGSELQKSLKNVSCALTEYRAFCGIHSSLPRIKIIVSESLFNNDEM